MTDPFKEALEQNTYEIQEAIAGIMALDIPAIKQLHGIVRTMREHFIQAHSGEGDCPCRDATEEDIAVSVAYLEECMLAFEFVLRSQAELFAYFLRGAEETHKLALGAATGVILLLPEQTDRLSHRLEELQEQ